MTALPHLSRLSLLCGSQLLEASARDVTDVTNSNSFLIWFLAAAIHLHSASLAALFEPLGVEEQQEYNL